MYNEAQEIRNYRDINRESYLIDQKFSKIFTSVSAIIVIVFSWKKWNGKN